MDQTSINNRLLRAMSPDDFAMLSPNFELVPAPRGMALTEPDVMFEHAFFFETGIGSVLTISPEGLESETGLFGWEGFIPVGVVMGADRSPYRTVTQVPGEAHRVRAEVLRKAAEAS